jgi:hypothetical protein
MRMPMFSGVRAKRSIRTAALVTVAAIGVVAGPVTAGATVSPATCNASNYWAYLQGSTFKLYLCGVGTTNLSGPDLYTRLVISNHSNRIWLHQNPDGIGGWAACFRAPNTQFGIIPMDQNPGNVQISSNTAAC